MVRVQSNVTASSLLAYIIIILCPHVDEALCSEHLRIQHSCGAIPNTSTLVRTRSHCPSPGTSHRNRSSTFPLAVWLSALLYIDIAFWLANLLLLSPVGPNFRDSLVNDKNARQRATPHTACQKTTNFKPIVKATVKSTSYSPPYGVTSLRCLRPN